MSFEEINQNFKVSISARRCLPFVEPKKHPGVMTCSLCHVKSPIGMESHNFGTSAAPENKTVCPVCHACLHLDLAGKKKAGIMIYLPELTQAQLNALVVTIFAEVGVAAIKPGDSQNTERLKTTYKMLSSRRQPLIAFMGASNPLFDPTSPLFMAQQIEYARKALADTVTPVDFVERIGGVRFLADPEKFKAFLSGAGRVLHARFPSDKWIGRMEEIKHAQERGAKYPIEEG